LNDTYGHHAGDAVLQRFATLLAQMLRRSDVGLPPWRRGIRGRPPDIDANGAQAMLSLLPEQCSMLCGT